VYYDTILEAPASSTLNEGENTFSQIGLFSQLFSRQINNWKVFTVFYSDI